MTSGLALDREALEEVRSALRERIREGLAEPGGEIKALPAYLPPPRPGLEGRAIVVDTGGTNMRAALVDLREHGEIARGPITDRLRGGRGGEEVTAADFFGQQAALVERLEPAHGLPVGYCFSYPAEITPERDARLLRWTKGIEIAGVEGTLVGSALRKALAAVDPGEVRVLNDTVAALLGGAGRFGADYEQFVGAIVGTGTNMASFLPAEEIRKLPAGAWRGPMAVNLESGNFHPPRLTTWDEEVDAATDRPGAQRLEKAVSGYYLPFLFERIVPDHAGFDPRKGSRPLVELRDRAGGRAAGVAGLLLARSADLMAASAAAIIDLLPGIGPVGVLAEGSLFWGDPLYAGRVGDVLETLLGGRRAARLLRMEDANLIGSAFAALA